MKKSILLIAISMFAICLNAQIKSFTIDGSKVYENGTRTAYLSIDGDFDADLASIVTAEIKSNPDFKNFSFYASPDFSKLMFTADKSLTEQMVVDLINEIAFGQSDDSRLKSLSFAKVEIINGNKVIYFECKGLNDQMHLKDFHEVLVGNPDIISVEIDDNQLFKLTLKNDIRPEYIQTVLKDYNAFIDESYLIK
jgi:hypothetical protein